MKIVHRVDSAVLCPGNPDHQFISLWQARGGTMRGERRCGEYVAFIDRNKVVDTTGQCHSTTVRRVDCDILCDKEASKTLPCHSCQCFCSTLLQFPDTTEVILAAAHILIAMLSIALLPQAKRTAV